MQMLNTSNNLLFMSTHVHGNDTLSFRSVVTFEVRGRRKRQGRRYTEMSAVLKHFIPLKKF